MYQSQLNQNESKIAKKIIELAEIKYLQELQINNKTSFNLLKILSAYNQILLQYGISSTQQSRIYNHLLKISRKYNPQTKDEWKKLISNSRTMNFKLTSKLRNNSTSSFRKQQKIVKFATKQDISKIHLSSISEFNLEDGSRSKEFQKSRSRNLTTQVSNMIDKKHISSLIQAQTLEAFSSIENQQNNQTKIIKYNFLDKLNHNNTQYLNTRQKRICFSAKQKPKSNLIVTEYLKKLPNHQNQQKLQLQIQEQIAMNRRAIFAHRINVQTKVFLIFKAIYMIHQQARIRTNQIIRYSLLKHKQKYFNYMKLGIENLKQENIKKLIAINFYKNKLKQKVFSFFKILKALQIKKIDRRSYLKSKISIEFIFQLILNRMPPQIKSKFQYFLQNKKYQQIFILFKVFSNFSNETQYQQFIIDNVFENVRLMKMKQIFNILKKQKKINQQFIKLYNNKLKSKIFETLKDYKIKNTQNQFKISQVDIYYQQILVNKIFQTFKHYYIYSVGVSKKAQYLARKQQTNKKSRIIQIWHQALENSKQQYVSYCQQKLLLEKNYEYELKKLSFESMKQYKQYRDKKKIDNMKCLLFRQQTLQQTSFNILFNRILQKKKIIFLKTKFNKKFNIETIFKLWRQQAGIKKLINKLTRMIMKVSFKQIKQMYQNQKILQQKSEKSQNFYRIKTITKYFQLLRNIKLQFRNKIQHIKKKKISYHQIQFIKCLKIYSKYQKQNQSKKRAQYQKILYKLNPTRISNQSFTNYEQLNKQINQSFHYKKFMNKLKYFYQFDVKSKLLRKRIVQFKFKQGLNKILDNFQLNNNKKILKKKRIQKSLQFYATSMRMFINQIQLLNQTQKKCQLLSIRKLSQCRNKFIINLIKIYELYQKQQIKSQVHYQKSLIQKYFKLLKQYHIMKFNNKQKSMNLLKLLAHHKIIASIKVMQVQVDKLKIKKIQKQQLKIKYQILLKNKFMCRLKMNKIDNLKIKQLNNQLLTKKLKLFFTNLSFYHKYPKRQNSHISNLVKKIFYQRMINNIYLKIASDKQTQIAYHQYANKLMAKAFYLLNICSVKHQQKSTLDVLNIQNYYVTG